MAKLNRTNDAEPVGTVTGQQEHAFVYTASFTFTEHKCTVYVLCQWLLLYFPKDLDSNEPL